MATKKRTDNKQPGDDSALEAAVEEAAEEQGTEKVVVVSTTETLHLRDIRPE